MSRDGMPSDGHSHFNENLNASGNGLVTPSSEYFPMMSPSSVESGATVETVRPANPGGECQSFVVVGTLLIRLAGFAPPGSSGTRSPLLGRPTSTPTTLPHGTSIPVLHSPPSPRLPPVSEQQHGPPSVTSIGSTSICRSSTRRNERLRAPLRRLASYSQGEQPYISDEDSDSAAEADIEAVQAELDRSWEHNQPAYSGTVRQRRRQSSGITRGKGSRKGSRYEDDYDTGTMRRVQHSSRQEIYPRETDVDEEHEDDQQHLRSNRHHHDHDDTESISDGVPDSEASYTLKDRQDAINITHPFGLKIWKPALYKKSRSVQRTAEGEIHSRPGQWPDRKVRLGNVLWTLFFGWWMGLVTVVLGLLLLAATWWSDRAPYAFVFLGLAKYLVYPFGRFIELTPDEAYAEEDIGEGQSISQYQRYGAVDLERGRQLGLFSTSPIADQRRGLIGRSRARSIESWGDYSERDSLLGGDAEHAEAREELRHGRKLRFFGRGQWSLGRILFYISFYLIVGIPFCCALVTIAPMLLIVCGFCWLIVFALPMAKVMSLVLHHLRRHPLSMTFHSDLRTAASRRPGTPSAQVLVCTYRAWGWEYYKYTIDGTNIFFVNLIFVVFFTIVDEYFLAPFFQHRVWFVQPGFIFTLALASIVPLAYFIGMAVASISAQSSMGMGAAINAFFGSVVEVFLYSVALTQGKSQLVEGSVVGSIFAGCLMMPGISMLFGALRRKTQRFNAKSAGVTSTMLLFSVLGAFAPTLFYQIYGRVLQFSTLLTQSELRCTDCEGHRRGAEDCRRCYWDQANALTDPFYLSSVKPFSYICSIFLVTSYIIGLWFSLRTHAAQIWETPLHGAEYTSQPPRNSQLSENWRDNIPDERFLKRIGERISREHNIPPLSADRNEQNATGTNEAPKRHPSALEGQLSSLASSFTGEDNTILLRNVAEVAAAAATLVVQHSQSVNGTPQPSPQVHPAPPLSIPGTSPKTERTTDHRQYHDWDPDNADVAAAAMGGHDAPNWSRSKSSIILLVATVLYAIIAGELVFVSGLI